MSKVKTVGVPEPFEEIFFKSEQVVGEYFRNRKDNPEQGTIEISNSRYILVRAASMSVEFYKIISDLFEDKGEDESRAIASSLLFDIAHAIGKADAEDFRKKMDLQDPVEKLSAGPVHFAHTGWAFVDILPESAPAPNDDFFLVYNHKASFESDAWIHAGKHSDHPVCIMNCGYSSGWCEVSFGLPLVSVELTCRAKGDEVDHFIMAPPHRIEERLADYAKGAGKNIMAKSDVKYEIPGFFNRKVQEEQIRIKNAELERVNNLMIDRELKMAEMKAEIEALKQRLKD
jgi:predicted hydrocarbon binding protein